MSRLCRAILVATIASTSLSGCSPTSAPPETSAIESDSHTQMVDELAAIRDRSLTNDPFFEEASIADTQRLLALTPEHRFVERFKLNIKLGNALRRLGKNEQAVEFMEAARRIHDEYQLTGSREDETRFYFEVGLTYLRLAETDNCVHCQTGESCILPIVGGGIHQKQAGSRKAVEYFQQVLELDPQHVKAIWLLNIASMTLGEYPQGVPEPFRIPVEKFRTSGEFPRFTDIASAAGLKSVNCGGGAVVEDFDNDGLFDILTSTWAPGGQLRYFRNQGDGTFKEETEQAGLTGLFGGINMAQADYDNDGDADVVVVRGAWLDQQGRQPNSLLQNQGNGRFRDVTFEVGLGDDRFPSACGAWMDFDNDGDVDLYIVNEEAPAQLYRNDGPDGFTDIAPSAGVTNGRYGKTASWGDFNNDRWPDLYVSNLGGNNRLYQNNGDGTFRDVAESLGVVDPHFSFPCWFWDVNNDGRLDLYVASYETQVEYVAAEYLDVDLRGEPDRLYLGNADGGFDEVASEFGLTRTTQPMGSNFGDLDQDGYPDFYLGTGYPSYEALMPNLMFHNRGGTRFEDVTVAGGFGHLQKGHGTAFADLDNDGDQDVFTQMGGAYPGDAFGNVLFENPGPANHWLRVKLIGSKSNRAGLGARIRIELLEAGERRTVYKWVNSGGTFGASPLEPQIGLGQATEIAILEVYWPTSDTTQRFEQVPLDRFVVIHEDDSELEIRELQQFRFPHESLALDLR